MKHRRSVGIVFNRRARLNVERVGALPTLDGRLDWASPQGEDELHAALARFARIRIELLVIDGGDGTVRDVLTAAQRHFPDGLPKVALIPSGKTNALAHDLGLPRRWTLTDAMRAFDMGGTAKRSPLVITRSADARPLYGFLLGAGAFVQATALAQQAHRLGAFRGFAVAGAIAAAITQTMLAGARNPWRTGERITIDAGDGASRQLSLYLLLASTLERMPLGLKPFGAIRRGMKLLMIEAPPREVIRSLVPLLIGSDAPRLRQAGYNREDAQRVAIEMKGDFVLDGERFGGGAVTITHGAAVEFVVQ